jgi:hypothetical protein
MLKNIIKKPLAASAALLLYLGLITGCSKSKIEESALKNLYSKPLARADKKLEVYHLGHSLVGRTMPSMLQQLAGSGHNFRSQLGWGTSLKEHWEPKLVINGFEEENDHENYLNVFEAIRGAQFDAFVLTEMVEIKDAIKYHDSAHYLQKFVEEIVKYNPDARVYLYESWHEVTNKEGWIPRLDRDFNKYWLSKIVDRAHIRMANNNTIYLIPVGQVMSAFFKEVDRLGGIEGISKPEDIFRRNSDGGLDAIHVNDIGNYLVALVHYSVLYQTSPEGLPYQLKNETGDKAVAPSKEAALLMQEITWRVVSENYRTGLVAY